MKRIQRGMVRYAWLGVGAAAWLIVGCSAHGQAIEGEKRLSGVPAMVRSEAAIGARVREAYGRVPLSFEANQGQTDSSVKFLSRGSGFTLFLTSIEAVLVLRQPRGEPSAASHEAGVKARGSEKTDAAVVRMRLEGANARPQMVGLEELSGKSHYFLGNDPAAWRTNIPTYARVSYQEVYRGIDLVYYGNQGRLEFDFVVAPGADPGAIRLRFQGAVGLAIDAQGDLILATAGGDIRLHKPVVHQEVEGGRREIAGAYVLKEGDEVGVDVAVYDTGKPLIIDPVLSYSTYLGGRGADQGLGIAVDASGNAYVTGVTESVNFPTTAGAFQPTLRGFTDVFVTKLNPTGSALVYSTYLGGSGSDFGSGIALDASGNAYVTGSTSSVNFPTTAGAFQTTLGGFTDAFVTKLNPTGSALVYSTYLGGSGGDDVGNGIAVDASGNAYVRGATESANFPTTAGAFQTTFGGGAEDVFVTKLNPTGSALVYSTYLGGSGQDCGFGIAVDASGNAYVTGFTESANFPTTAGAFQTTYGGFTDAFVTKLNPTGSALVYSTYLGGSGFDSGNGIAVDASGNAYVTGDTRSFSDFPTTAGAFQTTFGGGADDVFVTKLNPTGSALVYSTFLGGSGNEEGQGIAVDASGNAYVTGETRSPNFPTTAGAFQTTLGGGASTDAFVTKLNPTGSALVYSTYLGGSGGDGGFGIALDASGNAYVTGFTESANFPTTAGAFQTTLGGDADAFMAKIVFSFALSLATNGPAFRPGDSVVISVGVENPGLAQTVDFYFGALLPDGDTVVFFTNLAFNSGVGRLSAPATLRPIVAGVNLTAPFAFSNPSFFTYRWVGTEPAGSYALFLAAVRPGALADNRVDPGDIVVLATSVITFTP